MAKKVTAAAPRKPARTPDRAVRIDERGRRLVQWPDDDLAEIEHPKRRGGWLGRVPKDWLWGRRR